MTATFAPTPWSAPAGAAVTAMPWRLAREVPLEGAAGGPRSALQWVLKRNCSITPAQLGGAFGAICAVALLIAAGFWWLGYGLVLGFTGLELGALGLACLVFARHDGDRETITQAANTLELERRIGRVVERAQIRAEWVRVEPARGQGSLVELAGQGQRVRVGRTLRPEMRHVLARELRLALRRAAERAPLDEMTLESKR